MVENRIGKEKYLIFIIFYKTLATFSEIVEKLLNLTCLHNNFYHSLFIMIKHMHNNISTCFYELFLAPSIHSHS